MTTTKRLEDHDLHGTGPAACEVYALPPAPGGDYWGAVTRIPCPVDGCHQTVIWYEAGYVPGYRVCAAPSPAGAGAYDPATVRHHFLAAGNADAPTLIRDAEEEVQP